MPDAHWIPKEQYDALQAEVARLREALKHMHGNYHRCYRGCSFADLLAEPAAPQQTRHDEGCLNNRVSPCDCGASTPRPPAAAAPQPEEGNAG